MLNLADLLHDTAVRLPEHMAVSDDERTFTYGDLCREVGTAAETLAAAGVGPGQLIGLQLGNSAAFIVVTYALWRCGAVVVPIPLELRDTDRTELIQTMGMTAVVAGTPLSEPSSAIRLLAAGTTLWVSAGHQSASCIPEPVHAALVRFTSGTTQTHKGVVLSHEGIFERISTAYTALGIGPNDTVIWCLPMVHHFVVTIIQYLWQGAHIVILRNTAADHFLAEILRTRATVLYASPFHYEALAQDTSDRAIPSVRLAISTTTALSAETATHFRERYGLPLMQAYGIIELGLACINTADPTGRPDSVGKPTPGFAVRLANAAGYAGFGEGYGEIEISGPGFFAAYFRPWTPSQDVMDGSWFHTGDVGRIDGDGFLFLHSRTNSVINVAGMKVFPEEIERVMNSHMAVKESRAYGVRHAHLGEVVEAEVVLRDTAAALTGDALRTHCAQQLAAFKVPNRIRFTDHIDRTLTTGKIKRRSPQESPP